VFQIELAKNYNKDSFKQDLMLLMIKAGVERLSVTFLFTDSQIADEIFLEYINNMLNSGEVPNLFTKKEDYEDIINRVRPYNKSMKRVDSPDVIYSTFIQTVQDNLHIVLCMSPVGENLRVWCRKFPSLVNCCTLDWFSAWPEDALKSVAYTKLADI
jgi:dynein heavy chain